MYFLSLVSFFELKSILFDITVATCALFCLLVPWNIFFPSFYYQIVFLDVKWVSYRQHVVSSCFLSILPISLLIVEYNLFTFKLITLVILLFVFHVIYSFFVLRFLHYCLLLCLVDYFSRETFKFFLIYFCVYL